MKAHWLFTIPTCFIFFISFSLSGQEIDIKGLDSLIMSWDEPDSPGGYLAIFKGEETIYSRGFGYSDIETQQQFTTGTLFPISSMTKHMTAICVLKLVEEGRVKLDDELVEYFPELESYAHGVLIKDLLNHTSGIASWPSAATMRGYRIYKFEKSPLEWLVDRGHLEYEPGEYFRYSNTSFWLAGELVRRVSGQSLPDFAVAELFSKLGMSNTFYRPDPNKPIANMASGYVYNHDGEFEKRNSQVTHLGPVGVYTTVDDFQKWDQAMQNETILTAEHHKLLQTSYALRNGAETSYAYGQVLGEYEGIREESHGGLDYDWGYESFYARFPEYNLTYVFFKNNPELDRKASLLAISSMIFKKEIASRPSSQNNEKTEHRESIYPESLINTPSKYKRSKKLAAFVGTYYSETIDATYFLSLDDNNSLMLNAGNLDEMELSWIDKTTAKAPLYHINSLQLSGRTPVLKFRVENKEATGFLLDSGGANNIEFSRIVTD